MKLASTFVLALCFASPASIAASASYGATSMHKHSIQVHQAVRIVQPGCDGFGAGVRDASAPIRSPECGRVFRSEERL